MDLVLLPFCFLDVLPPTQGWLIHEAVTSGSRLVVVGAHLSLYLFASWSPCAELSSEEQRLACHWMMGESSI